MMYQFTANLLSEEDGAGTTELADRVYAQASDATCFSKLGDICVVFDRDADNLEHALVSAMSDLKQAGAQVRSVEIEQEELECLTAAIS